MGKTAFSFAKGRLLFSLVVIGLVLALIEASGNLNVAKGFVGYLVTPIQFSLYRTYQSVANQWSGLTSIGTLRSRNVELEIEKATLEAQLVRIASLEKENEALRGQLGTKTLPGRITIQASVIGLGTGGLRGTLLIDRGDKDSIEKGDFIVLKNVLIGSIVEVGPKTARVKLLTDPSTKIPAFTSSGALGLLVGEFGTEIKLTDVVQESRLKEGDLVLASGEADFPRGLVMGKIVSVNRVSRELFQEAKVEALLDTSKLQTVFVLKRN